jgi:ribosomal protein S18 acetylase RimI-like enzyme
VSSPRAWVAGPHEAESVARLLIAFRDHHGEDWPSDNAFLAGVERLMDEPHSAEFLLGAPDADSAPAGVVQLRFRYGIWRAGMECLVEDVFVEDHARGRGLARTLLELATERARARDCRIMELDVHEDNVGGLALYERFGFVATRVEGGSRRLFLRRALA